MGYLLKCPHLACDVRLPDITEGSACVRVLRVFSKICIFKKGFVLNFKKVILVLVSLVCLANKHNALYKTRSVKFLLSKYKKMKFPGCTP